MKEDRGAEPDRKSGHEPKDKQGRGLIIGIDATNLRQGGGATHLIELLDAANPEVMGVTRVIVWGCKKTLAELKVKKWLKLCNPVQLEGNVYSRTWWQRFSLPRVAREANCDLLFVPGGSYAGDFRPVITMSRNMLPFEPAELSRYGFSLRRLRLLLLRFSQSRAFRQSDGVIFLTRYASEEILKVAGPLNGQMAIIPHGLSGRFLVSPRRQNAIHGYSTDRPYKLIYVSIVNQYKHQWNVVEAVAHLRQRTGWSLALDLVGPAYPPALLRLEDSIRRFDPAREWVCYRGEVSYASLHTAYREADLGIFASSCENMPNTLLETMGTGLPVACSDRMPMREILQDGGVYFDPERPMDIAGAIEKLIASPELRAELSAKSYSVASAYSWERCAEQTFAFIARTISLYQSAQRVDSK